MSWDSSIWYWFTVGSSFGSGFDIVKLEFCGLKLYRLVIIKYGLHNHTSTHALMHCEFKQPKFQEVTVTTICVLTNAC